MSYVNDALTAVLDQTRAIFHSVNHPFPNVPGASDEAIRHVVETTGIHIGEDLASLWRLLNGSDQEKVFAVISDVPVPVNFLSTERAVEFWMWSQVPEEERLLEEQDPPRNPRIRHSMWSHPLWLPFAEYNEGGTTIYYDVDPGPGGSVGQIIVYQHDPDGIYYVAPDLISFMHISNAVLNDDAQEFIVEYSGV